MCLGCIRHLCAPTSQFSLWDASGGLTSVAHGHIGSAKCVHGIVFSSPMTLQHVTVIMLIFSCLNKCVLACRAFSGLTLYKALQHTLLESID